MEACPDVTRWRANFKVCRDARMNFRHLPGTLRPRALHMESIVDWLLETASLPKVGLDILRDNMGQYVHRVTVPP